MKYSVVIPVLFAALGSFILILNSSPRVALRNQIANSKDRGSVQNRLREIGKTLQKVFWSLEVSNLETLLLFVQR